MFERVVEQDGREYVDNHLLVQKKMNLAASHGQMLRDEQAKVSVLRVEREAR